MRTRTWIEDTASEWSAPATYMVLDRPVAPTIFSVGVGHAGDAVQWPDDPKPSVIEIRRGEGLVLTGEFPIATAADLRARLRSPRGSVDLRARAGAGSIRLDVPTGTTPGDWRLLIGTRDGRTPQQDIATVRVH